MSVLLVEDDSMVRGWVRLALRDSEFRLAGETSTAADALELPRRRRPDLLLVVYRLPDRVGTEYVRDLRTQGIDIPALLMTANAERGFNEAVRDSGAQGSVLKSGKIDELLAALHAASQPSIPGIRADRRGAPPLAPSRLRPVSRSRIAASPRR